ncbi:MAG: DASS family sodium-coupled anion symporter [Bdellovibrionales bacterium]|nr:DASS family sodium-coupled anion symporter [Bdellovibrionales bacterium]
MKISPKNSLFTVVAFLLLPPMIFYACGFEKIAGLSVFSSTVLLWLTEALPLPVTGLLVPVLITSYGILPAKESFQAFGSDILFLFIGCFFLARAMEKHGWDKRMAYWILSRRFGNTSPAFVITAIALFCWTLSMWISNTATCAMMTPIALGIAAIFREKFSDSTNVKNFEHRLLLTCAFASSIGGLATPIGSPPNLIALQFLRDRGISVNFLDWTIVGLPISATMLFALLLILRLRYPIEQIDLRDIHEEFRMKLNQLGHLKREEIQVASLFSLAVLLWLLPGILSAIIPGFAITEYVTKYITFSVVGIGVTIVLFMLPSQIQGESNLTWSDANAIDWGTILLFGGGLSLGMMLDRTGLAQAFGSAVLPSYPGALLLILITVVTSVLISEFASNTASAAIVIPIILGTTAQLNLDINTIEAVVLACAFGASYGFMLPVSTPPNAIVYGTGKIAAKEMVKSGILFDLTGILIIVFALWLFYF